MSLAPAQPAEPAEVAPAPGPVRDGAVLDRWIAAGAALCALVTGAVNLFRYPIYAEGEGIYAMQAWAILHGRITPYPYWYDHPFLGWLQIAPFLPAGQRLVPGAGPVDAARLAALAALAVDAALIYLIARRLGLRRCAGMLGVALFVLSPLVQTDGRRVFLDNIATPWVLAAVACAVPSRPWDGCRYAPGVCFGLAVLTKETTALLGPAILVAVLRGADPAQRGRALRTAAGGFVGIVALYPLYAALHGQLLPASTRGSLVRAVHWQLSSRPGSGSVFDPSSQRYRLMELWLSHDRVLLAGGLMAATAALAIPRLRAIGVAVLVPTLWVLRPGGYLPSMFEVALLPFLALALAGLADTAVGLLTRFAGGLRPAAGPVTAGALGLLMLAATLPAQQRLHDSETYQASPQNDLPGQAVSWIHQHLPLDRRLLVDDVLWVELAAVGRTDPWQQTLWMYQPDTSPSAARRLPNGWKDIQYVVSTRTLRGALNSQPRLANARRALYHSTLVVTFGAGKDRIELRRVTP